MSVRSFGWSSTGSTPPSRRRSRSETVRRTGAVMPPSAWAATRSEGARADCDGHPPARMKSRRVGARTRMSNRQRKVADYRADDKVDIIPVIRPKLQGSCVALECLTGGDAPELSRCNHLGCGADKWAWPGPKVAPHRG